MKTRHLFWLILGSARKASGGFPSTRELNFHFCSRAQNGLQNGSQNGAFWAPRSELYSLWGTICENLVPPKAALKKGWGLGRSKALGEFTTTPPYMVRVSPSGANRGFPRPQGRTTGGGNQHNDYHTPGDPVGVGGLFVHFLFTLCAL